MMFKKNNLKFKQKAFTLVEVIVSVAILVMLIGVMATVETQNIKVASKGRHQLQATDLARGALDLVRTIRDTNLLAGSSDSFAGLSSGTLVGHKCPTDATPKCSIGGGAREPWTLSNDPNDLPYSKVNLNGIEYTVKIKVENP